MDPRHRQRRRRHREPRAPGAREVEGASLRRALALNELTAQFQPIFSAASGDAVGLEALVRWRRPGGHLMEARQFLEAASQVGLICQLDHRIMGVVARTLVHSEVPSGVEWISVNLAPESLRDREVTRRVAELVDELERFGLGLVVEIPAGEADAVPAGGVATLESFRASGARVALDHFGAGGPGLDRLLHFPVDMVKLDERAPPSGRRPRQDGRDYLPALVGLCRSLGLAVGLERVETPPRRSDVLFGEVDFVQGHGFGRPAFLDGRP